MTTATLLANAVLALASALVYGLVGRVVSRRPVPETEKAATRAFGLWWSGLAGISVYSAITTGWAAMTPPDLNLFVTFLLAALLVLCVALWGLAYYLAYVFSGRTSWRMPLAAFYGAFFVWLVYLVQVANPTSVTAGPWSVTVAYEHPVAGAPLSRVLVLLLLLPLLVGAAAYLVLGFRAKGAMIRYRVRLVAGSLLAWFGSSLVANFAGINQTAWWPWISRGISLAASLVILAAYQPPQWVRARLETAAQGEGVDGPPAPPPRV